MKNFILLTSLVIANQLIAQTFNKVSYNSTNSGLPHNQIRSISIDSNDIVWVGTQQGGLARFDGENWSVWNSANSNLPGNNVRLVQSLANGDVWLSLITNDNSFPYRISKLDEESLINWTGITNGYDIVDAFDYFNNKVWISTLNGLYIYENDTFSQFDPTNDCIPPTAVSDILFVTPDKYWIALSDYSVDELDADGLLRIEQNNCIHYDNSNSGFPSDNVTLKLRKDKDNPEKVWMLTNAGIVSFDDANWEMFAAPGTSLPASYAIDSFGDIWAGYTFNGLQKYDGTWHSYQSLVSDEINDLAIDSHNNIWVGTQNSGLIKLERVVTSISGISSVESVKCYPTILGQELFLEQGQDRALSLLLMDINSKVIVRENFTGRKTTISLAGYRIPSGVYFYCIKNANNDIIQTGKLLKTE